MNDTLQLSRSTFATLLGQLTGRGNPNPDDPLPAGPWGPVVRHALGRVGARFGPHPEPWVEADLNPQPLPPHAAFAVALAQAVIDRAGLMQDVADGLAREGQQRGIIIVSGYLSRFIDDCGNDRLPHGIPAPGPRPHHGPGFGMLELVLMGAEFERHAQQLDQPALAQEFRHVGVALTELGLARG
jgi:hypothetical protein